MTATTNPFPTVGSLGISRRACIDLHHPAETAIRDAARAVESLGADLLLTWAGMKLFEAQDLVADWLEGKVGELAALQAQQPVAPAKVVSESFSFSWPASSGSPAAMMIGTLTIDTEKLATLLARRARRSKAKKATASYGAVSMELKPIDL